MFRFYRFTATLIILFSAVIVFVRAKGVDSTSPVPMLFMGPDGEMCRRPCLFGIRVGETKFSDALDLLIANPMLGEPLRYHPHVDQMGTQNPGFFASWRGKGDYQGQELWIIASSSAAGLVSGLGFYTAYPATDFGLSLGCIASLGTFINFLGEPFMDRDMNGLKGTNYSFYRNAMILQVAPREDLLSQPYIYRPRPSDCVVQLQIQAPYRGVHLLWCGFTPRICPASDDS